MGHGTPDQGARRRRQSAAVAREIDHCGGRHAAIHGGNAAHRADIVGDHCPIRRHGRALGRHSSHGGRRRNTGIGSGLAVARHDRGGDPLVDRGIQRRRRRRPEAQRRVRSILVPHCHGATPAVGIDGGHGRLCARRDRCIGTGRQGGGPHRRRCASGGNCGGALGQGGGRRAGGGLSRRSLSGRRLGRRTGAGRWRGVQGEAGRRRHIGGRRRRCGSLSPGPQRIGAIAGLGAIGGQGLGGGLLLGRRGGRGAGRQACQVRRGVGVGVRGSRRGRVIVGGLDRGVIAERIEVRSDIGDGIAHAIGGFGDGIASGDRQAETQHQTQLQNRKVLRHAVQPRCEPVISAQVCANHASKAAQTQPFSITRVLGSSKGKPSLNP